MPAARKQRTGTMDAHAQFRMNEMRGRPNVEPLPEGYTGDAPEKVLPNRSGDAPEYKCPPLPKVKAKRKAKRKAGK